jgi:hypothetical protein
MGPLSHLTIFVTAITGMELKLLTGFKVKIHSASSLSALRTPSPRISSESSSSNSIPLVDFRNNVHTMMQLKSIKGCASACAVFQGTLTSDLRAAAK